MEDNSDALNERARLTRVKTALMVEDGALPPHDLAWLFRLAEEALKAREGAANRSGNRAVSEAGA